jgi:hypothetical protein
LAESSSSQPSDQFKNPDAGKSAADETAKHAERDALPSPFEPDVPGVQAHGEQSVEDSEADETSNQTNDRTD